MNNPWTFTGQSSSFQRPDGSVTLVEGDSFVLSRSNGDFRRTGPLGLFCFDTRVLSDWIVMIDGAPIDPLATVPDGPFAATYVGRRQTTGSGDSPITVIRTRWVGRGMLESLELRNHGTDPLEVEVGLVVGADFASVFDVKADRVHEFESPALSWSNGSLTLSAGPHSPVDATRVHFDVAPDTTGERIGWHASIEPGGHWNLCCEVGVVVNGEATPPSHRCDEPPATQTPSARLAQWRNAAPDIETDDPKLQQAIVRATEDLGSLRIFDPLHHDRVVVAAGAPWFMTLFGRDSILTAWMTLLLDQHLAIGVLESLAALQGQRVDDASDEEPGRILHEVRADPGAAALLGGANVYFGTADATPLFVMLAAELLRWTGRTDVVERLLPAIDRAMAWITDYGDPHGIGFVTYERKTDQGLENQGWKDSWDGIRYGDGTVARAPIALSEVQAYVHAAHVGRADIAEALSDPVRAQHERAKAARCRSAFHESFWIPDAGFYATGIDGEGRRIDSLASNMGHCLWAGIVPDEVATTVAEHLVSSQLYSGWGLRTLATTNPGYNPVSYHCGSVWPHDTAIAIAGLTRYKLNEQADQLSRSLLDCSAFSGGRLPELFAGFARGDLQAPIPYPTSCSPQAWAAASPLLIVRSLLGLQPDLANGKIRLRPRLLEGMRRLHAEGIPVGDSRMTVDIVDGRLQCSGLPGDVILEVA